MRKPLAAIAAATLALTLSACTGGAPAIEPIPSTTPSEPAPTTPEAAQDTADTGADVGAEAESTTEDFTSPPPAPKWEPTEEPEPEPEEVGTRANPGQPGEHEATFEDGENTYIVTVGLTDTDATSEIMGENQFNDQPGEGEVYITVPVTVTYEGPETMTPWLDVDVALVSANGRSYEQAWAVIPDDFQDIADLYDGGTATGNIAFLVPQDSIEDAVFAVSAGWFSDPLFFALVSE